MDSAAAWTAKTKAPRTPLPRRRAHASAAEKTSPAPVVSVAATGGAGTAARSPGATASAPAAPRVTTHIGHIPASRAAASATVPARV